MNLSVGVDMDWTGFCYKVLELQTAVETSMNTSSDLQLENMLSFVRSEHFSILIIPGIVDGEGAEADWLRCVYRSQDVYFS